jgi:hypothetical protein
MPGASSSRYYALAVFVAINVLQGVTWSVFANVPNASKELFPGLTDFGLVWLMNSNSILQMSMCGVVAWLLTRPQGLRNSVLSGAALLLVQSGSWMLASSMPVSFRRQPAAQALLFVGAAAGGAGCAFMQGAPSLVSAVWFPLEQRGRATAAGYTSVYVGTSIGYLISLSEPDTAAALKRVVVAEAAICVLLLMIPIAWFPNSPSAEPIAAPTGGGGGSDDTALAEITVLGQTEPEAPAQTALEGLEACCKNPSCVYLVIACSAMNGSFISWQSVLPIICGGIVGYTSHDGDVFAFISGITYCIGGFVGGELGDRFFVGRLKTLLLVLFALLVGNFIFLIAIMPSPLYPEKSSCDYTVLVAVVSMTGLFAGAIVPPALELLADVAFPVSEGTTANLAQLLTQGVCVVFTAAVPGIAPEWVNTVMGGIIVACGVCMFPVANSAARLQEQEQRQLGDPSIICKFPLLSADSPSDV